MKLSLTFSLLIFSLFSAFAQTVTTSPLKVEAGSNITITYHAEDGPLKGKASHAIIYATKIGEHPIAHQVQLDNLNRGTFKIPKEAQALFIVFANKEETIKDTNEGKGYVTHLYQNGKIAKNSNSSIASTYMLSDRVVKIDQNMEEGGNLLIKEFDLYPSNKSNIENFKLHAYSMLSKGDKNIEQEVERKIKELRKGNEKDQEYALWLALLMQNNKLYAEIENEIIQNFPFGKIALKKKQNEFEQIESLEAKIIEFEKLKSKFSKKEIEDGKLQRFARQIAVVYGKEGNKKMCSKYVKMISNADFKAELYNDIAWTLSGESLSGEGKHLKYAEELSKKSLNILLQEKIDKSGKPVYFTDMAWNQEMDDAYASYSDTYALLAHKLGDHAAALKYQTIAVESFNFEFADMNNRYAIFKEKVEGEKAVLPFLEKTIVNGTASDEMKDQFFRIFVKNIDKEEAAKKYMASLEKEAKQKHIEKVKNSMFKGGKKPFSLLNLEGEEVSLENMIGKVVVIKFWAIWCAPCKKSFPGMQQLVDKYANDDVEFLFVNTWGSKEDNEELVREFIKENKYDLQILLDSKLQVLSQYNLSSVPTQIILDQSGQIRFRDRGFSGTQELVDDLTIIIDELIGEVNQ